MRVIVIGAGVIGLTCAVRLAEAGHETHVIARDLPLETTSAIAAALWYPYHAAPAERVHAWSLASYTEFSRIAETDPDAGVRIRGGIELLAEPAPAPPPWAAAIEAFESVTDPVAGYRAGWSLPAPVVDMGHYLPWLVARLDQLGGSVTRASLTDLPDRADVVVNACGLAARKLARDHSVTPVRGQVVVVEQIGLTSWWLDAGSSDPQAPAAGGFTYIVPRLNEIVIGGTSEPDVWDRAPDPATADRIVRGAARFVPALIDAPVIRHAVGLRPVRPTVRLETGSTPNGGLIVHCYGHGGSGVTMSWGFADEVLDTVRDLRPPT